MKSTLHTTTAERTGRWFGRVWKGCVQQETRAVQWLAGKGLSVSVAQSLLWIVKLVVFVVLLYVAFWLVLLLAFVVAVTWLAQSTDLNNEKQPELRDGHSGIGWYNKDDLRIDMIDSDDP